MAWSPLATQFCLELAFGVLLGLCFVQRAPLGLFFHRMMGVTASAGFAPDIWWLPGVRVGYRKNLVGTEVSYVSAGATLFKYFNLDVASSLDTVEIDGRTLPRGLMVNLGFELRW